MFALSCEYLMTKISCREVGATSKFATLVVDFEASDVERRDDLNCGRVSGEGDSSPVR